MWGEGSNRGGGGDFRLNLESIFKMTEEIEIGEGEMGKGKKRNSKIPVS